VCPNICYDCGMIVVIVAGGSGTRLWPLSTPNFPKHLLQLTDEKSLLQHTYERSKKITNNIYVITEASHSDEVRKQLPELDDDHIIIEPGRRGTGSCFVAGLERISHHQHNGEPVFFTHSDHRVRDTDAFVDVVEYAGRASQHQKRVTLIGVEPTYPATGFGYIHKGNALTEEGEEFVYEVQTFKEKPEYDVAQEYVQSGEYLWNTGYFIAPLEVFLEKMEKNAPQLFKNYHKLRESKDEKSYHETYLSFDNLVIDYELMETTPDLLVVPGTFDWMDIGSFNDLPDVVELDEKGNHLRGDKIETIEIENSYIRNEEDGKTVAVIGLDNIVVVNTPHGVLVTRRDLAQRVGEIAKKIQAKTEI